MGVTRQELRMLENMTMPEILLQGFVCLLLATNVESRGVDYFEHYIGIDDDNKRYKRCSTSPTSSHFPWWAWVKLVIFSVLLVVAIWRLWMYCNRNRGEEESNEGNGDSK